LGILQQQQQGAPATGATATAAIKDASDA
jgi:hypothetical protein